MNVKNLFYSDIQCDIESENENENRESQLAEATRTSYIEGRWVSEEEDVRMEYSINDAYLPANGNYSSYHEWGLYVIYRLSCLTTFPDTMSSATL